MMSRYKVTAITTITTLFLVIMGMGVAKSNDIDMDGLKQSLHGAKLSKLKIIHLSYEVRLRARADETMLAKVADSECIVSLTPSVIADLLNTLDHAKVQPTKGDFDLRWGLFFQADDGVIAYSIFLDGKYIYGAGRHGVFNGSPVSLDASLIRWVEHTTLSVCPSLKL